uniref:hypothetical protein n=1 Tax=Pseudomonas laurentiana TaxID=2364649 RepID=UPI0029C697BE|nr:hypothetical protein [Pseudomonas laurentiana]
MQSLQCVHRNYTIVANVEAHPGIPLPFAGGCLITSPEGHTSRRLPLPLNMGFLASLEKAQHASIAHGKWLVDQQLDKGRKLFG